MSSENNTTQLLDAPGDADRAAAMAHAREVLAASRQAVIIDEPAPVPVQVAQAPMLPPDNYLPPQYQVPMARPVHKGPRRVRLTVSRIDPWSVMKMAFLLALAVAIMSVVAVSLFWLVIDHLHIFSTLQEFINDAVGSGTTVNITQYFEFGRLVALATLISVVNVVITTILAAIMTILYNITSALVGGVRLTLIDD
ncbi:MAG: DUF3566 domain-containing protein [Cellulomonadaceae bacterium]|jgi:hypothetical protein|nr:DUF3566 domain-containing protein [Cellulomonadaceae bacterium]